MGSIRQSRIEGVILEELSVYFQRNAREICLGSMVSVTVVRVTSDLSLARCYISIFAGPDKNEVLESIREIKSGNVARRTIIDVPSEIKRVREKLDVSQAEFAEMIGISKRTLQEWEQGRCKPTGAALKLLMIARRHPEVLHA